MDEFQLRLVPLAASLETACEFCKPIASLTKVKIELNLEDAGNATVQSDDLRLQQVLINLTSNAIKYTQVGSRVVIKAQLTTLDRAESMIEKAVTAGPHQSAWDMLVKNHIDVVVISVSDEGKGVSKDAAGRLFGRFSQLDNQDQVNTISGGTVGQPVGSGLGLNLCLKFVQRIKGNIWVTNTASGVGCTFSFFIPLASGFARAFGSEASLTPINADTNLHASSDDLELSNTSDYRVLVVDDSVINRKVVSRMLRRVGIETVAAADSGPSALELLEGGDFNVVITDIHMPEMSGPELSQAIREDDNLMNKPVVVGFTADGDDANKAIYEENGIVHLLHKPITKSQMQDFFENIAPQLSPITR